MCGRDWSSDVCSSDLVYLNGNEDVAAHFSEYLEPFDLSQTLTIQNANQTDPETH